MTTVDSIERFLGAYGESTRDAYRRDLDAWLVFCAPIALDPIKADRFYIELWVTQMRTKDHLAESTIGRRLSSLSGFFERLIDDGVVDANPVSRVKRPRFSDYSTSTGLSKAEAMTLMAGAEAYSDQAWALTALLLFTGVRISEALSMDIEDIYSERGHSVVPIIRKGGKRGLIVLNHRVLAALDAHIGERTDGPIFATRTGQRLERTGAWRLLRRLATVYLPEKAESLHPHDFRHAFVTLSLDAGVPLRDVQDAAGHADPRTTRRYDRARHNLDNNPTYTLGDFVS